MPIASGMFKQLVYKAESTFGTAAGQASGQSLRRIQSTLDLAKEVYQSAEIRTDMQVSDFRHGVRRVAGTINGELSPLTWKDWFATFLRRDFAAVTAITGASITVAGSGPYTVTRAAGSFLTDGFKIGDVIRLTVGSFHANNINKNLLITALTATVATVVVLNGTAMQAEGPIATSTVTVVGKKTFTPQTGHTDKSFSVEHWHSDLAQSELFLGCKPAGVQIALPPTGIATVAWDVRGQDMAETAAKRGAVATTSQYFTTPTAATTSGSLAAVNGVLRLAGAAVATLTGLSLNLSTTFTGDPVVGSNIVPGLFPGRVLVSGQATAYFDSVTLRDAFINETEADLIAAFTADNTATAEFMTFVIPRLKFGGASKDDGEKGLVMTLPFTGLLNSVGGTGISTEKTTLSIQDSLA